MICQIITQYHLAQLCILNLSITHRVHQKTTVPHKSFKWSEVAGEKLQFLLSNSTFTNKLNQLKCQIEANARDVNEHVDSLNILYEKEVKT